ncbi:hypothetical protein CEXT_508931 [Caerostris extrusa]|uniref:Uncharacterized protein n=1 Tax=Caerostris extrusa TaxID=172846 RepID=A0AAV4MAE4_CAEEX|nr:hypothetical protein CEXT_508931 [Caerostris extrusa]
MELFPAMIYGPPEQRHPHILRTMLGTVPEPPTLSALHRALQLNALTWARVRIHHPMFLPWPINRAIIVNKDDERCL